MNKTRKRLSEVLFESNRNRVSLKSVLFEAAGDAEKAAAVLSNMPDLSVGPGAMKRWLNGPGSDPKVRAFLARGQGDGNKTDEKVSVTATAKELGPLVPTQNEIELSKSIGYPLSSIDALKKIVSGGVIVIGPPDNNRIIVSDNIILDGHHRWSQALAVAGPSARIAAYDIKIPGTPSEKLAFSQVTIAAATPSGPVKDAKAGGINILGVSGDEIKGLVLKSVGQPTEAGEILSRSYIEDLVLDPDLAAKIGVDADLCDRVVNASDDASMSSAMNDVRDRIASHVAGNLSQMNQPAEGSPPRVDMPQFDKASYPIPTQIDALKTGKINYKPKYVAKESTRSTRNEDDLVMERWLRLAGIVKG